MTTLFGGTEAISRQMVKIETQVVANATAVVHLVVLPRGAARGAARGAK